MVRERLIPTLLQCATFTHTRLDTLLLGLLPDSRFLEIWDSIPLKKSYD